MDGGSARHPALLLKVADAMAARRRRKIFPSPPFLPYLAATIIAIIGVATLAFLLWRAWPAIVKQWNTASTSALSKKDRGAKQQARATAESPAESLLRLKKENEALREENNRLLEQLKRSSEALTLKNAELDELKLRLLILEKTRATPP
jgi:hypothetical protein